MCLLLLLANLLLWENVSSTPDVLSIKDLYDNVIEKSHTNYDMSADIYHEFVSSSVASCFLSNGPAENATN